MSSEEKQEEEVEGGGGGGGKGRHKKQGQSLQPRPVIKFTRSYKKKTKQKQTAIKMKMEAESEKEGAESVSDGLSVSSTTCTVEVLCSTDTNIDTSNNKCAPFRIDSDIKRYHHSKVALPRYLQDLFPTSTQELLFPPLMRSMAVSMCLSAHLSHTHGSTEARSTVIMVEHL